MKLLLFVLSLALTSAALAAGPISGLIVTKSDKVYLDPEGTCKNYLIHAETKESSETLRLLSDGDSLSATGHLEDETCTAKLETVDFVGLKSVLGFWYNEDHFLFVQDFNSLIFYPRNQKISNKRQATSSIQFEVLYRYSITPKSNSEWAVFFSDKYSTQLATLSLAKSSAILKVYDSENGQLTNTLKLNKWSVPLK